MGNILNNLISKRFYSDRDTATAKVDACFAMNRITAEQYSNLLILIEECYPLETE